MRKMYSKKQIEKMGGQAGLNALDEYLEKDGYDGGLDKLIEIIDNSIAENSAEAGQPLVADGDGGVDFGSFPIVSPNSETITFTEDDWDGESYSKEFTPSEEKVYNITTLDEPQHEGVDFILSSTISNKIITLCQATNENNQISLFDKDTIGFSYGLNISFQIIHGCMFIVNMSL